MQKPARARPRPATLGFDAVGFRRASPVSGRSPLSSPLDEARSRRPNGDSNCDWIVDASFSRSRPGSGGATWVSDGALGGRRSKCAGNFFAGEWPLQPKALSGAATKLEYQR